MRIVLLTLYYPPSNTIAALRLKAFEKHLLALGHEVDVLTRYYDKTQQEGQSMLLASEPPKNFNLPYVREENVIYTNFDFINPKKAFSEKLPPGISGIYNYLNIDVFHYGWMEYALEAFKKELSGNRYDFIISSYGPPIAMRLAVTLSETYNIPYLIDFRDSYIDERDKGFHLLIKKWIVNRYLKNVSGYIFATEGMKDFFCNFLSLRNREVPCCVVYNGIEEEANEPVYHPKDELMEKFEQIKKNSSLLLLYTGTLYEKQNIQFFIKGVEEFNTKHKLKCAIVFVGLADMKASFIQRKDFIYLLPKISHEKSLYLQKQASALLLPVWDGRYTGFSGKTQEYIFSENIVITSPNPQADLSEFFDLSPNIFTPANEQELEKILLQIIKGSILKVPMKDKTKLYRSYWVKQLSEFLQRIK
jgi:glycosyltransferase involved in cell wall biosynthesis